MKDRTSPLVDTNAKTARVIVTMKCNRGCKYCANKSKNIIKPTPLSDLKKLLDYDVVCLTGGEPLLDAQKVIAVSHYLKKWKPTIKIFMYSSIQTVDLPIVLQYLDGVLYTIHDEYTGQDITQFSLAQHDFQLYPDKSFRLALSPRITTEMHIIPNIWKEIKIKKWFYDDCIVPVHEDFFILK
jgi:hypothetical protein